MKWAMLNLFFMLITVAVTWYGVQSRRSRLVAYDRMSPEALQLSYWQALRLAMYTVWHIVFGGTVMVIPDVKGGPGFHLAVYETNPSQRLIMPPALVKYFPKVRHTHTLDEFGRCACGYVERG